jgi:hypothetical protein
MYIEYLTDIGKHFVIYQREVLTKNPFAEKSKWTHIASDLPLDVDSRRVRERTLLLIEQRRKHNSSSPKKDV